jgi:hypothetical protein
MAGISDNLEIFRKLSKKHYADLVESLEEKYCWKCPMRPNKSETFCGEVDSWVRLSIAFDMGIHDHLREMGIPDSCLEVITAKFVEKQINQGNLSNKLQKLDLIRMEKSMGFGIGSGDYLVVQHGPKKLISGDKVLLPNSCPLSNLWYTKSCTDELPLKVFAVTKVFHKSGVKYIQTSDNFEVPFEYVYGVILKIIKKEDSIYTELNLNRSSN